MDAARAGRWDIPEAIFAMGMGRGGWRRLRRRLGRRLGASGAAAADAAAGRAGAACSSRANCGWCCLKLIADQPRHGYDLIQSIEEMTDGSYAPSPGVVYPTLTMLEDMGLIEEQATEGSRKAYAATAEGQAHLDERPEEVEA